MGEDGVKEEVGWQSSSPGEFEEVTVIYWVHVFDNDNPAVDVKLGPYSDGVEALYVSRSLETLLNDHSFSIVTTEIDHEEQHSTDSRDGDSVGSEAYQQAEPEGFASTFSGLR